MLKNFQLLHQAAIKIQSLIRGFLGRRRVERIKAELERQRLEDLRNKAATTIQAAWRGYLSRKNNFDFYKYKDLQRKNDEYRNSIDSINSLESLATMTGISSKDDLENTLNNLLNMENIDDILKLSPSRVCALQGYIDAANRKCLLKGFRPAKKNVILAQKLGDQCSKLTQKDSLDAIFPDLTDVEGIIHPDTEKAAQLKDAIKKLRENIEMTEQKHLKKQHYLLRTYQQPGVLSNIGTHLLTAKEEKLKSLKFWEPAPPTATTTPNKKHTGCGFPFSKKFKKLFKAESKASRVPPVPVFMNEFISTGSSSYKK
ncbi:unnamed protein product [Allacma fusca]|uniref:Uncharacterized protein n=1 Tax=Allacma fusca TaxID=39272 RepID=A0A8J2JYE5_9HEXA|nr:unnamed protein product [Allacma fusca]